MKLLATLLLALLVCGVGAADTAQEQKNLLTAEEFMSLNYDPAAGGSKAVAPLLAPDCVFKGGNMPQVNSCAMWSDVMASLLSLAPDFNFTTQEVFAKDDMVAVVFTVSGTFTQGEYQGIKANGQKMETPGILTFKFDSEGKIAEIYNEWDMWSMWSQLGWTSTLCNATATSG